MARFSYSRLTREIQDIAIAVIALTFAFSISSFSQAGFHVTPGEALYVFVLSLAAVLLAFLMHELAHRQVARRYGGYAEFRIWPMGLLGGVLVSFLGFVIAAPGAVYMQGIFGNERVGKTALAGPATNIVIGTALFIAGLMPLGSGFWEGVFLSLAQINFYLGAFNMVPFPPLDGQKVLAWNMRIYVTVFVIALFLAVLSFVVL